MDSKLKNRIFIADAFTDKPFGGNPAAICILDEAIPDSRMQSVAAEMNLSETAFILRQNDGYSLRWFTPAVEVDLCGHATLASAHILWEQGYLAKSETANFHTRSGLLTAVLRNGLIELDFPAEPDELVEAVPLIGAGLGVNVIYTGRNRMDYIVEVESENLIKRLKPDFNVLRQVKTRGIIVTAPSSGGYDFVSRFFGPAAGIDEDPVTGSAHCCLAPYWARKLGKNKFRGYQASARGGVVVCELAGDRVKLSGNAVTVLEGNLTR